MSSDLASALPESPNSPGTDAWEVCVLGAGAAGLMAAIRAAETGARTLLVEKNPKPGVKILASGGGRCNLTTTRRGSALERSFPEHQRRFLRHALRALPPERLTTWFAERGVATREERWEKVFPVAGRASVVVEALVRSFATAGGELRCATPVESWEIDDAGHFALRCRGARIVASKVILATGGRSYPRAGTCGDGYRLARDLGHRITPLVPALVGLRCGDQDLRELAGLSVEDAGVHLMEGPRRRHSFRLPVLFTHQGLSGPAPMNLAGDIAAQGSGRIEIDLQPALDFAVLDAQLVAAIAAHPRRGAVHLLAPELPERLRAVICRRAGVEPEIAARRLDRGARRAVVHGLGALEVKVTGTLGWERAEVTRGGISLEEVDPRTLESRVVSGLYLAGEVLDVDGPIGGFNFQAAFATGALAGTAAARSALESR